MTTLTEIMDKLPDERRRWVESRARALIAQEMSLRNLRKAPLRGTGALEER